MQLVRGQLYLADPTDSEVSSNVLQCAEQQAHPPNPIVAKVLDAHSTELKMVSRAIGGVPLVARGRDVSGDIKGYASNIGNWRPMQADEVGWDPENTEAAFSALGCTSPDAEEQQLIMVAVTEQVTVKQMAELLLDAGVWDAILLGGSADVQQWVHGEQPELIVGNSRANTTNPGAHRKLNGVLAIVERRL